MRSHFFGCVVGVLLAAIPAAADRYPRQPGVDVQHYAFRVTLSDDTDAIRGETTVTILLVKDGVTEVAFDLASPTSAGKGMTVSEVTLAGVPVKFDHRNDRLRIPLGAGAKAGVVRAISVTYGGVPASGLHILKNKFGERCFFSVNWPTLGRQWLPMIDHPYDKATSEFAGHRAGEVPGGGQRSAGRGDVTGGRAAGDALEAGGADRVVAEQHRGGAVCDAPFRPGGGRFRSRPGCFTRIARTASRRSRRPLARRWSF